MKILFTGGGTGGHIFPIIGIVREIRKINSKDFQFFYIGPEDELGKVLLSQEGIKAKTILSGKIRRYLEIKSVLQNIFDVFFKIPIGFFQSFFSIFFLAPDLIFSKGGYGSIPVVLSAWILRVPIFLHESDVSPGLANKFLSKFALKIFISFPKTEHFKYKKTILSGNPIRRELLEGSKEEAVKLFKLSRERPIILIMGGSQGAQRINDFVLQILPELLKDYEIIHQCGEKNFKQVRAESNVVMNKDSQKHYHLFSFFKEKELKHFYASSDLIISRAGAGSIFEIAAFGKPSIMIPLFESAQNHQIKNAYTFAKSGASLVIEEINLIRHLFLGKLKYLFSNPEKLEEMSQSARQFSKPKSAKMIAEYIIEYLKN